jgi:hypothetical protein
VSTPGAAQQTHTVTYRGADDAAMIGEFVRDAGVAAGRGWKPVEQSWTVASGQRALEVRYESAIVTAPPAQHIPPRFTAWSPAVPGTPGKRGGGVAASGGRTQGQQPKAGPTGRGATKAASGRAATTTPAATTPVSATPHPGGVFHVAHAGAQALVRVAGLALLASLFVGAFASRTSTIAQGATSVGELALGLAALALIWEGVAARLTGQKCVWGAAPVLLITALVAAATLLEGGNTLGALLGAT